MLRKPLILHAIRLLIVAIFVIQPALVLAAPQALAREDGWSSAFLTGVNGPVYALAFSGSDVYVGGDFTQAGGVAANHIARWNYTSHQWFPLGLGANGVVNAIAIYGAHVYVGGAFYQAGGQPIQGVALWNWVTSTWSPLGAGTLAHESGSPQVKALKLGSGDTLFIGGQFNAVGGVSARNVAYWNGSTWLALAGGLGASGEMVEALVFSGGEVYAGGNFTTPQAGVARWNGVWNGLGSGTLNSPAKEVSAIALYGGTVYIGGAFTIVTDSKGDQSASHVAMWDIAGSFWSSMSSGMDGPVYALATDSAGNVFAGGQFASAGGSSAHNLAVWSPGAWSPVATSLFSEGADSAVYVLAFNGSPLYAGGAMTSAGGASLGHVGRLDITARQWTGLGSSLDGPIYAVAVSGSDVYVGGAFTSANGILTTGIARWSAATQTWSSLGSGITGCYSQIFSCVGPYVNAILVVGSDVYVGGAFTTAGGVTVNSLARWNTASQTWNALSASPSCATLFCAVTVNALAWDGTCLDVGGTFESAGAAGANLAAACGASWANLAAGATANPNGSVQALAWDAASSTLYAGGAFSLPYTNLFAVHAGLVSRLGSADLNGAVQALAVNGSGLYVGGAFTLAGGLPAASYLARLNPPAAASAWQPLGAGFNGPVSTLAFQGSRLIAGGSFTQSGVAPASHIAQWDGAAWHGLSSGANGDVRALAPSGTNLYAGGAFSQVGGKLATSFSRWSGYQVEVPIVRK